MFRKGDIVYTNMGSKDTTYHTQRGWRPAVVIARSETDKYTVIPFTTKKKNILPTHVLISDNYMPVIKGENVILCENCTQLPSDRVSVYKPMYNIRLSNPDIWENILKGLSNQLSKKFDQFAEKVEPNYRRGSVVRIKGASAIFLIVSNEKNNLYSGNLTIMPLRIKQVSETCLSADFENQEVCAADLSACINIAKGEISEYLGYVGKGFANSIVKEFLQRIKEEG